MTCGRCGRRLSVAYTGNPQSRPVYRCDKPNLMMGLPRCMTFGGPRVDAAIARELLLAVEPMAIDAAFEAERMHREQQEDQQRILDLEMQQARYEASLAERRYAACDPDNRLIAAQLEKNWEAALRRVRDLETRQPAEKRSRYRSRSERLYQFGGESVSGLECAGCHDAGSPATASDVDHRHHRRCRR